MTTGNHRPRVCLTLMAVIVSTMVATASLPLVTQAAPSALPPRPSPQPTSTPSLPPRPIGQPTPESAPVPPPPGGFIELHVLFTDGATLALGALFFAVGVTSLSFSKCPGPSCLFTILVIRFQQSRLMKNMIRKC